MVNYFIKKHTTAIIIYLMVIHAVCFLLYFVAIEWYSVYVGIIEHFFQCSFITLFLVLGYVDSRNFFQVRVFCTLSSLWAINAFRIIFGTTELLYFYICVSLIYGCFLGFIIHFIWENFQRKSQNRY